MIFASRANCLSMLALVAASFSLAACGLAEDEDRARVTVIEDEEWVIKPIGIDLTYASAIARSAIAKGLVGFDEQGRVVPSLAARWIVTDDGMSYIFRLNDGQWNDGRPVTAERVATLLRERIGELSKSRLGPDLLSIDEIVPMTGRVIEIRLTSAHPNFLQLMAQPELGLFRAGNGAGPMSRLDNQSTYTLGVMNPPQLDDDETEDDEQPADEAVADDPRRVTLRSESAARAVARYTAGYTDVVLNGKFHHLPLVDEAGVSTNDLRLDPVAGLFGFQFLRANGFWAVPRNREILAMAIDRPALLTSFPNVTAWQSRQKIIPEALDVDGIDARPGWASMTMQDRQAFAREHVARWEALEGPVLPLTISLPDAAGADILFLRVQSDLRRVGLDAVQVGPDQPADIRLVDEIAAYDSAKWFLYRLTCSQMSVCLNDADTKIAEAEGAINLQVKARLYAEAEEMLVQHYSFIPLAVPVRWSISRPSQQGLAVNPRGWHPLNLLVGIPIS
ncbi:ABC transporter substrate-binding protein [Parasphingorhabdus cellanae]|uniref:ABC transporter substrate-binding protein n=1 Tax=Parasphingorhabdus cellanae TaxID=2806553 RepID=A0ABX7T698_9SPHN|nr:ABC transporter substrate-binding protein [Parasphingorhabdus cellanae]QTD57115.1 ABC transporter substrate-binding protein [Parasphingorhabdus cellanae]